MNAKVLQNNPNKPILSKSNPSFAFVKKLMKIWSLFSSSQALASPFRIINSNCSSRSCTDGITVNVDPGILWNVRLPKDDGQESTQKWSSSYVCQVIFLLLSA
jgi:hypothetical protein